MKNKEGDKKRKSSETITIRVCEGCHAKIKQGEDITLVRTAANHHLSGICERCSGLEGEEWKDMVKTLYAQKH